MAQVPKKFVPFQHIYQEFKQTSPRLFEALDRMHAALAAGGETHRNITNVTQQGGSGPFTYRLLLGDLTVDEDPTDHLAVYGALIDEPVTIRRISVTLKKIITADLTVKFWLFTPDGGVELIKECTVPSAQVINEPKTWVGPFDKANLPDMSVIWPSITASDGSTDSKGICTFLVETVGRHAAGEAVEGFIFQGDWLVGSMYAKNDLVYWQGSEWISNVDDNIGNQPDTSPTEWHIFVSKGDPGGAVPLTTKGDLVVYDIAPTRLGVGLDGSILTADSTSPVGISWIGPTTPITVDGTPVMFGWFVTVDETYSVDGVPV